MSAKPEFASNILSGAGAPPMKPKFAPPGAKTPPPFAAGRKAGLADKFRAKAGGK